VLRRRENLLDIDINHDHYRSVKGSQNSLPSFSYAKWSELAPKFDLPVDLSMAQFDLFSIAPVLLPPSFHEAIAEVAWRIQDVYQERISQESEAARIRVFDAYLMPIVGLFQGRIIDKPENPMMSTAYYICVDFLTET